MKTIKEYFESVGNEVIRQQLLENYDEDYPQFRDFNIEEGILEDAIFHGFYWKNSPQGGYYWYDIWVYLCDNPESDLSEYGIEKEVEPEPESEQEEPSEKTWRIEVVMGEEGMTIKRDCDGLNTIERLGILEIIKNMVSSELNKKQNEQNTKVFRT